MAYKVIAFDFDGTLVDSRGVATSTVNSMAKGLLGKEFSQQQIESWRERDLREVIREVGMPGFLLPIFIWQFRRNYRRKLAELEFFPGILDVWQDLQIGGQRQVGVVTSNSQKAVLDTFARQGVSNHAATDHTTSNHTTSYHAVSGSQLLPPKFVKGGIGMSGKRNALQKIIEKYQIEKTDLLYLGDEIRDVTSCIEVGVDIAAVSWGFNTRSALASANPTYILEKPEELRQLVGI